jgi:adenylosuccinate lyase
VPRADADACRDRAPLIDDAFVAAVAERERTTDHAVASFVDVVQEHIGPPAGSWIHYGLTSSDVVDTALCWAMRDALDLVLGATRGLLCTVVELAHRHLRTVMVGRTHGIHAEPTTFGAKAALWAFQVERDRRRLAAAREAVAVCKLSGAVGTYSNVDPRVEEHVGARLGLRPVPASQVIARDRHAEFLWTMAAVAATCELVAVELRHLQRTEVGEVREGFKPGQKGSSAMPHKRNPISAETISGLARVVRSNLLAGLQDVALWHERDISHSSVERIVLPDSSLLVHYMVTRLDGLLANLEIDEERMAANLWSSHGLVFSQPVLLALVAGGRSRDEAYRIVQRNAILAAGEGVDFRSKLEADPEVTLDQAALDAAFDVERALPELDRVRAALDAIDVEHEHQT